MFNLNSSRLRTVAGVALLLLVCGSGRSPLAARERVATVAVFPVENLGAGNVPAAEVRQFLIDRLAAEGVRVLEDEALEAFMVRHRVRYAAGIDTSTAESLREETGVDGVVIASIELSSEATPAKVALFARLVSLAAGPVVVWAEDISLAGDEAPGFFELGLINDHRIVLTRSLARLWSSLASYLKTGQISTGPRCAAKFRPKAYHRSLAITSDNPHSVAVVPFFNLSERRNAGEIVALHFIRHLSSLPQFRVVDTGVVRQQLLDARIIMDGGLSISDAETVAALLQAEFVLAGRVMRYADYDGPAGRTGVHFSTALIEKKTRRVVWSSDSYNEGSDGVGFFERGTSKTAHAMATQMVKLTTDLMVGRDR